MKNLEKYKKILQKAELVISENEAELIIDSIYQLAFTTVSKYINERSS